MMRHPCLSPAYLLAFALILGGCAKHDAKPADDTAAEESLSPVKAVPARPVSLGGWTELLGATRALPGHTAWVSAAVEGHVLSVAGDGQGSAIVEGQRVEKGQIIVRLDDRIVRANREKVIAGLEEIAQQKKEAESAVKLAQLDVQRLDNLSPTGAPGQGLPLVSRLEREKARIALEDAEAKQLALLAKERGTRTDLQVLDLQLEYFQLRAPIGGNLGTVSAVPGQTLPIGTTVAEVVDLAEIDVFCLAPPAAAARLRPGQPAALKMEAAGDASSAPTGKVAYVAVQAQPETGSFPTKVRFPNPDLRLRANAVVRVEVLTEPQKERLCVPAAALLEDQDPPGIVVVEDISVKKDDQGHEMKVGKAKKLRATIGVRDRERGIVEIVALEDPEKKTKVAVDGQLFVIEGGHGLHDDDAVKLEEQEEKKD